MHGAVAAATILDSAGGSGATLTCALASCCAGSSGKAARPSASGPATPASSAAESDRSVCVPGPTGAGRPVGLPNEWIVVPDRSPDGLIALEDQVDATAGHADILGRPGREPVLLAPCAVGGDRHIRRHTRHRPLPAVRGAANSLPADVPDSQLGPHWRGGNERRDDRGLRGIPHGTPRARHDCHSESSGKRPRRLHGPDHGLAGMWRKGRL